MAALCLLAASASARDDADTVREVVALVDGGEWAVAETRIGHALDAPDTAPDTRRALQFERERMRRIRLDFPLDETQAETRLRDAIPDLRAGEFAAWTASGALEHLVVDGEPIYFARAVPNLFRVNAEAASRRRSAPAPSEGPMEVLNAHHADVVANGSAASRRIRVTQAIEVEADAVPAGERVRAWIPYPRQIPGQQENIQLLASRPTGATIAPASTLQRTAYLEQVAVAGTPTVFEVEYELTVHAQYHAIDPDRVVPLQPDAALQPFLAERAPHVVFTDALRRFSRQVVGDETHPYRIAQRLFAAVDRIPWASAREYSTISNISDYALRQGHADCGQQTLLLVALLRLNGIPARWQSGMVYSDGEYDNLHDWGALYLAPYGWVPMDVTTGLLDSDDEALKWFYLGGLDAYRIAFNDDYSRELVPHKAHFRSETVDSQRGEVEWAGGNLYFDQWDYRFTADVVDGTGGTR